MMTGVVAHRGPTSTQRSIVSSRTTGVDTGTAEAQTDRGAPAITPTVATNTVALQSITQIATASVAPALLASANPAGPLALPQLAVLASAAIRQFENSPSLPAPAAPTARTVATSQTLAVETVNAPVAQSTPPSLTEMLQHAFFNTSPTADPAQSLGQSGGVVTGDLHASDPDGNEVTYTVTEQPTHGTVVVNPDGSYTYTPDSDLAHNGGTDHFTVSVDDGAAYRTADGAGAILGVFHSLAQAVGLSGPDTTSITVPVSITATTGVGSRPQGIAVSPDGKYLYVANYGDNTVSVIDTATNSVITTVTVGTASPCDGQCGPYGLTVAPDGSRVYVTDSGFQPAFNADGSIAYYFPETTVSVIDTATYTVTNTIDVGQGPVSVAVSPDGKRVYVGYPGGPTPVRVIDTDTNTVISETTNLWGSLALAVSPDGKRVYVAGLNQYNSVSVIDTTSNTVDPLGSLPGGASAIATSPDGTRLYVTSQNRTGSSLTVLNAADGAVIDTIPLSTHSEDGQPWQGVAVSPDGKRVYVVDPSTNSVLEVDTATNTVTGSIPVGDGPQAMVVSPDGKHLYVTNRNDDTVSVIDLNPDPTSVIV
jgi:YVTN family beta-propeller protein